MLSVLTSFNSKVDEKELKAIASEPADNFLFTIDSYDALQSIKELLAVRTCKGNPFRIFSCVLIRLSVRTCI